MPLYKLIIIIISIFKDTDNVYRIFNTVLQGANTCNSETQKLCFQIIGKFINSLGKL